MINGDTRIIAHVGYPTTTFKSPMIYNPWFEKRGINAAVVPLGVQARGFRARVSRDLPLHQFPWRARSPCRTRSPCSTSLDEVSTAVKVAGSCNAVRRDADGRLVGDMFDGEGFVRGVGAQRRDARGQAAA